MRFISLIAKNVMHRPVRTVLTTVGLAIAISAVDHPGRDLLEFRKLVPGDLPDQGDRPGRRPRRQLQSALQQPGYQDGGQLRKIEGVADVAPSLVDTVGFEEKNLVSVLVNGWVPGSLLFRGIRVLEGRALKAGDEKAVMLGRVLALNLDKKAGDPVHIAGEPFRSWGSSRAIAGSRTARWSCRSKTLQKMMGREDQVTGFLIQATSSDARIHRRLAEADRVHVPGVAATPARDHVMGDTQIRLAKAMSWTTAAVALILGSVGMLNTMLMSIFERTREIGILRAVGWRRRASWRWCWVKPW